jgi:hypothetical protein
VLVLFAAIAGVLLSLASPPVAPGSRASDGALAVQEARAGLARTLAARPDTLPAEPLPPCSMLQRDELVEALADAGVDAPVASWGEHVGPLTGTPARALSCAGAYVGVGDDPTFPELTARVLVADLGTSGAFEGYVAEQYPAAARSGPAPSPGLGGSLFGACARVDLTDRCVELWTRDGFFVAVEIADRIHLDRTTTQAVLAAIIPPVVERLAAGATDIADPLAAVTGAQVDAALAALGSLVGATVTSRPGPECPVLDRGSTAAALTDADVDLPVERWRMTASTGGGDGEQARLTCGDAEVPGPTLYVLAFDDAGAAAEHVASVGLLDGGGPAELTPGDLTVGNCTRLTTPDGAVEYCMEWWRQDRLVIGITLFGPAAAFGPQDAATVLVAVVPSVLDALVSP